MSLKGVGITGNQVFIQVFPADRQWARMRESLERALIEIGEAPIAYPNKAPIHMNILRITRNDKGKLWDLLDIIEKLRQTDFGEFNVTVIDFLITDFVLSPPNSTFIRQIAL